MESLKEAVQYYSDEHLLEQFLNHRQDYTEEALKIIDDEIQKRKLCPENVPKESPEVEAFAPMPGNNLKEDFSVLENAFSKTDILVAFAVLRDSKVVFYIDNPESESKQEDKLFTVHILKTSLEQARALLEEHFIPGEEGRYVLRHSDVKDRLRSFSFYDVHISESAAKEQLEVTFSTEERSALALLGERLLEEADQLETEQQRVVFHYDTIEPVVEKLKEQETLKLTRTDLLAILEVCQIYCDDPQFPKDMDEAIASLLSFFYGN